MKRILLLNDTAATCNPGCQAASAGVRGAYSEVWTQAEFRSLPVGYWAELFRDLATPSRECVIRAPGTFPRGREFTPPIDLPAFVERVDELAGSDAELTALGEWADLVVVNGEGSVHHHFPRALALLGLIKTLSRSRPVHLVNCTLQGIDSELWKLVGDVLAGVHVRESRSAEFVRSRRGAVLLTPDLAFQHLRHLDLSRPCTEPQTRRCLLTSGVLVSREGLREQLEVLRAHDLDPVYLCIGDGGEEKIAREVCGSETTLVDAGPLGPRGVIELARECSLAVSGRHHVNLFLAAASVPFIPLPSNTWKVESTLQDLGYPLFPCQDASALDRALTDLGKNKNSLRHAAWGMFLKGMEMVREFGPGVNSWKS